MRERGKVIVIDGPDGCGKGTAVNGLKDRLSGCRRRFMFLREPGGTASGERIRRLLMSDDSDDMTAMCECLLYAASRAQLFETVIIPAIENGVNVVIDRSIPSSLVFQGAIGGIGYGTVNEVNDIALNSMRPDLAIILSINAYDAEKRIVQRDDSDRYDRMPIDVKNRISCAYDHLDEDILGCAVEHVDATGTPDEVLESIVSVLTAYDML